MVRRHVPIEGYSMATPYSHAHGHAQACDTLCAWSALLFALAANNLQAPVVNWN